MMQKLRLALAAITLCASYGCATADRGTSTTGQTSFTTHIKPILERRCVRCHNRHQMPAGLDFTDRENVLGGKRAGTGEPFLIAGNPESSLIYRAITQPAMHPNMMPGDGWGLSSAQERHVYEWIRQGADWPGGLRGTLREKSLRVEFDGDL